jgi:hypothetical protein
MSMTTTQGAGPATWDADAELRHVHGISAALGVWHRLLPQPPSSIGVFSPVGAHWMERARQSVSARAAHGRRPPAGSAGAGA